MPENHLLSSGLPLPFDSMLARMYARDHSADGLFITGVITTGIYCLPSCPARKPKAQNVVFYPGESEAKAAGLRACRRCQPEQFYTGQDQDRDSLMAALSDLDKDPSAYPDVSALADRAGIGSSKLYTLAKRWTGETPGELIHKSRISTAIRLLQEKGASPTDTAFAVGYSSVSGFYERFKQATGATPREFAKRESTPGANPKP